MATVTVTEIIARAAAAADMEDNFVTATQWLYWCNVENRALAVKLARLGIPYKENDESISCTGASQYSITEPLAVLGVYYVESDASYRRLKMTNSVQQQGAPNRLVGSPESFHVLRNTGNQITFRFYPNPASGTILVKVIDQPAALTSGSSVSYPLNWEERIVLGMAQRALAKEETYNPMISAQIKEIDDHIEESGYNYMAADAPVIRNVRYDNARVFDDSARYGWIYF